eukprot:g25381.t1
MRQDFFRSDAPHPEPSSLTAFAGNSLDRRAEYRAEDCVEKALAVEGMHILAFAGSRLILKHDGQILDPLFAAYELGELQPDFDNAVLLGYRQNGEPRVAVPVLVAPEELASHYKPTDARALYREALIDAELQGEVAQAVSLLAWNGANRFCGKCGAATEMKIGGYKRECTRCQHTQFPRTDPVVIMLTVDGNGDRCLLGRSHHFQEGMYSCLAGFVEPGETIENAVRRETLEESGVEVGRIRYHASQPWPMPHSLMIGCYAEAKSVEIVMDVQEMSDVRWFSREEVKAMLDAAPEIKPLRTLYRDIASLQAQGAHIDGEAGLGYVLRPGFMLPPMMFSQEEIEALVLGSRWVAKTADPRLAAEAVDALAKIAAVLPPGLKNELESSTLLVASRAANGDAADLGLIRRAIRAEHRLDLSYRDENGLATDRSIWPFALGFFESVRVVVAWCELRQDFRHFRTDRIASVTSSGTRYPRRRQVLLKEWREAQGILPPP